jgi:hypothetical protein
MGDVEFLDSLSELERATQRAGRSLNREAALQNIESAVARYKTDNQDLRKPLTPAKRRDLYFKLLHDLRSVQISFETILANDNHMSPLIWVLDDKFGEFAGNRNASRQKLEKTVQSIEWHERWLAKATKLAEDAVNTKGGRLYGSSMPGLEDLLIRLADTWEQHTGTAPTRARVFTQRPHPSGPFIRFVEKVVRDAKLEVRSINLPEYVVSTIRERRYHFGSKPRPTAEEITSWILDGE